MYDGLQRIVCVLYSGADFRSTSSVQVVLWTARGLLAYRTTTPVCRNAVVVAVRSYVDDCVRRRRRVCRVSAATIERTTVWRPAGPAGSSARGVAISGRRPRTCCVRVRHSTTDDKSTFLTRRTASSQSTPAGGGGGAVSRQNWRNAAAMRCSVVQRGVRDLTELV